MNTYFLICRATVLVVICSLLLFGCSYKSYTKPRAVSQDDEKFLVNAQCNSGNLKDTACLKSIGFDGIQRWLDTSHNKLNMVCLENVYCPAFHRKFLSEKPVFDSIAELSTLVVFEEKYTDIPLMLKRFSILKYYGSHYILDEKDFGRFRDDRTKNKVFLEHFAPNGYKILDTPFSYQESTKSFPTEYHYLSATMYVLFDENLKIICVSLGISPSDVKRILNGQKPLQ